jgi:phosphoenolpyruvate synthase/pyruvate phosphate dikinase
MKNLLGGKGANLAEMSSLGLPVPPGFTITTEACVHYYSNDKSYPPGLREQVADGLKAVGMAVTPETFGYVVWSVKMSQVAAILPYLLLVLILIFRPKGLLGTREG